MILYDHFDINEKGHLTIGGVDTISLAEKYDTPLMVLDEDVIRANAAEYVSAMKEHFGGNSMPLFASKSLCFTEMYKVIADEGMGTDIVSAGELYIASQAGFPLEKAFYHGNGKTDDEIQFGLDNNVGHFVVDNKDELDRINFFAGEKAKKQDILLRVSPGIDLHTHEKIKTGKVDSKFGVAIETGQAEELIAYALGLENISLVGLHYHIGSQILDTKPFVDSADIMVEFLASIEGKYDFSPKYLNIGGGFGVMYTEKDKYFSITENIKSISEHIKGKCKELGIDMPSILMEPGRSIVAPAGLTLYTAGSLKEITGYKNYISIDGGMTDNPRYALYQSEYTCLLANKANAEKDYTCTIAGKCCESGDLIQEGVKMPRPERGDIIAVLITGAYNYSMASNYNKLPRPAIVLVKNGVDRLAIRRETFEDLISLDVR